MGAAPSSSAPAASSSALSTVSAASTITTGPCSGFPTPTTVYSTSIYNDYTSDVFTTTLTTYVPPTTTVTTTYTSTIPVYVYSSTTTLTRTSTSFVVTVIPAEATVTIPTVPGFTPVTCGPSYLNPTVYGSRVTTFIGETNVYITTDGPTATQTHTIFTTSEITSTYTLTGPNAVITNYALVTSTTTITRSDPTTTIYAACTDNNITPYNPVNDFEYYQIGNIGAYGPYTHNSARVPAIDAADCCNICQGNSACSVSAFSPNYDGTSNSDGNGNTGPCVLFLEQYPANITCSPSLFAGFTTNEANGGPLNYYISNGACGQWLLNY